MHVQGLQIERHLKKNIQFLERKQVRNFLYLDDGIFLYVSVLLLLSHSLNTTQSKLVDAIKNGLLALRDSQNQQRYEVMKILEDETSQMKLVLVEVQEKLNQIQKNSELNYEALDRGQQSVDAECRDVHITSDADSDVHAEVSDLNI